MVLDCYENLPSCCNVVVQAFLFDFAEFENEFDGGKFKSIFESGFNSQERKVGQPTICNYPHLGPRGSCLGLASKLNPRKKGASYYLFDK